LAVGGNTGQNWRHRARVIDVSRLRPVGSTKTYEFTSQFFFDDTLTDSVYTQSPYSSRGSRSTRNASDGIYNSLSTSDKSGLTLQASRTTDGYAGVINLGVNVG
jgi:hypothetical protein